MNRFLIVTPILGSLLIAGALTINTPNTMLNDNVNFKSANENIDKALKRMEALGTHSFSAERSSSIFWSQVSKAYNWLKNHNHRDRFVFLFGAVEASTITDLNKRELALRNWVKKEIERFDIEGYFPKAQLSQWKGMIFKINSSLDQYVKESKKIEANLNLPSLITEVSSRSLKEVRKDINQIASAQESTTINNFNQIQLIILVGLLGSITTILANRRRLNISEADSQAQEIEHKIEEQKKTFDLLANPNSKQGVDFEEVCKNGIEKLQYMFETAGITIHAQQNTPITKRMNAEEAKIFGAVDAVVRGAVALAQNQATNNLSMQWSCKMTDERAYFDIDILGKKFTLDELRSNHELLEGASIVSQFSRAEKHLETFRPLIKVVPTEGKTKISLGLEINPSAPATLSIQ